LNKHLSEQTILITGGTSRLGSSLVEKAVQSGARVFFTYYSQASRARELESSGAQALPLDLSDTENMTTFARQMREKTKHLDVIIHNAAAVRDKTIKNLSEEEWDYVMRVNLKAPYVLTKELMPLLFRAAKNQAKQEKDGAGAKIFFLISRLGLQGGVGVSNYSAAKAGLLGLCKSLAKELSKKKILVNAVNPGFMDSKMTQGLPEAAIQENLEAGLIRGYSNPEEVADFLLYLCSEAMNQVSGQVFHYESRNVRI